MTITYSDKLLKILAGVADPNERFELDEIRAESKFYEVTSEPDEITARRLKRAAHQKMYQSGDESLDEDPAMGQLSRRKASMHQASFDDKSSLSYFAKPDDIVNNPDYGFGSDYDELEKAHRRARDLPTVTGYGRGPQSGRFPGYGASIAGYISEDAE